MRDALGREINYMRLSVIDRCNLRCRYCMPAEGVPATAHADILRYEELLRVAQAAVSLGIDRFKVTGGEPLVRRGIVDFIRSLKELPGVRQVTLTTNGCCSPPCWTGWWMPGWTRSTSAWIRLTTRSIRPSPAAHTRRTRCCTPSGCAPGVCRPKLTLCCCSKQRRSSSRSRIW